jgi:hypothetical protein
MTTPTAANTERSLLAEIGAAACEAITAECIDHAQLRQLEVEIRCHQAQAIAARRRPHTKRLVAA